MSRYNFTAPRLFLETHLEQQKSIPVSDDHLNYLLNVMRLKNHDSLLVFNGSDGEWTGHLDVISRKKANIVVSEKVREQTSFADIHYIFSPLKQARQDYMVQKAVEMGASCLWPVFTDFCQVSRVNEERMRANCIEAAEQCGILSLPEIRKPVKLRDMLNALEDRRVLVFCDEDAPVLNPVDALNIFGTEKPSLAVLVGPEGGFSASERDLLLRRNPVIRLSLGPAILRADTAAIAALTLVQAVCGNWN